MARECGDCYWCTMKMCFDNSHIWKCKRKGGRVELDDPACSYFRSDDINVCKECEYYESGKYKWSTHGICTLKGTKRGDDDKACSNFFEY